MNLRALASLRLVWSFLRLVWETLTRDRAPAKSDEEEARERIDAWSKSKAGISDAHEQLHEAMQREARR